MLGLACLAGAAVASDPADEAMVGKALFHRLWVPAPTRTNAADGLGPLFNARSCADCHKDGGPSITRLGLDGQLEIVGTIFRIAGPSGQPHPWYGRELQTGSVPGLAAEASARRRLATPGEAAWSDVHLLGPELGPGYRIGPRVAPSLLGRWRLEQVAESAILEQGSAEAQRRLGLSGRARVVVTKGGSTTGRFGWKASQASLADQVAAAFATDLGLSTPRRPEPYGDCTPQQTSCLAMPNGESPAFDGREVSDAMLGMVVRYVATIDAPRAPAPPNGEALLAAVGCTACHVPRMPTQAGGTVEIFSDLLLHNMGLGLDDGVAEPGAASAEWRTAPLLDLWTRGGHRRYLHDGRSGSLADAIAWHDGEARASRQAFESLTAADRQALIRYLETL